MKRPGKRKPYTNGEIEQFPCIRYQVCGNFANTQWNICADDDGIHRPVCDACDIELNRMVLQWAMDPDVESKMRAYTAQPETA